MTIKKTAAKKAAKKRAPIKEGDPVEASAEKKEGELTIDSTESVEKKPRKKAAKKTAKEKVIKASDSLNLTESESLEKPSVSAHHSTEPKQGVRDVRTNKSDEEQPKDSVEVEQPTKESESTSDSDAGQQSGKNRNRRGRRNRNKGEQPVAQQQPVDRDELGKKAWKVFLGEVKEEGLALIGDKEGKELAKRSFRLAEIFLEEQARKVGVKAQPKRRQFSSEQSEKEDPVASQEEETSEGGENKQTEA